MVKEERTPEATRGKHEQNRNSLWVQLVQRHRPAFTGLAALQPTLQRHIEPRSDLPIV
jgi:hypothetical protein